MVERENFIVSNLSEEKKVADETLRGMWQNSHTGKLAREERIQKMSAYIESLPFELKTWLDEVVDFHYGKAITRAMQIAAEEVSDHRPEGHGGAKYRRQTIAEIRRQL